MSHIAATSQTTPLQRSTDIRQARSWAALTAPPGANLALRRPCIALSW